MKKGQEVRQQGRFKGGFTVISKSQCVKLVVQVPMSMYVHSKMRGAPASH